MAKVVGMEALKAEIIESKKEIFNLRFQRMQDPKVNLSRFKKSRKKIAQNLTRLNAEAAKLSKVN